VGVERRVSLSVQVSSYAEVGGGLVERDELIPPKREKTVAVWRPYATGELLPE